jgi:DNA-binding MarR family transcriptional regulator
VTVDANRYAPAARFRAALRRFLRESENASRAAGLTPQQYMLLLQIAGSEEGTATVSQLIELLSLTQSTVTELVQRAEQADLIARSTSPDDARVVDLRLTEEGARRLTRVHEQLSGERRRLRTMLDQPD